MAAPIDTSPIQTETYRYRFTCENPECQKTFWAPRQRARWCSETCKQKMCWKHHICENPECRKEFWSPRKRRKYCSLACKQKMYWRRTAPAGLKHHICENPECRKEFWSSRGNRRYCSLTCKSKAKKLRERQRSQQQAPASAKDPGKILIPSGPETI